MTENVAARVDIDVRSSTAEEAIKTLDQLVARFGRATDGAGKLAGATSNLAGATLEEGAAVEKVNKIRERSWSTIDRMAQRRDADFRELRKFAKDVADLKKAADAGLGGTEAFGVASRALTVQRDRIASTSNGDEFDRLRAKISPLYEIERNHLQTLNEIDSALRKGAVSHSTAAGAVDRLSAAYEKNRASLVASLQEPLNDRLGVRDDFGTKQRGEDIAAYGAELDGLRSKYSPLFAIEKQHLETAAEIERAARTGAISHSEAANAVDRLSASYEKNRAAQVAAIQAQMNDRLGVRDDFGSERRGADVESAFANADAIRSKYLSLDDMERKHSASLREIDEQLRTNNFTYSEASLSVDRLTAAYDRNRAAAIKEIQRPINSLLGVRDDFGTERRGADVDAAFARADSIRDKHLSLTSIDRQFAASLAEIDDQLRTNNFTYAEAAVAVDRLTAAHERNRAAAVKEVQRPLNSILGVRDDFNTTQRGADVAAAFGDATRMRAKHSPLFAAQQDYLANLREIRDLQKTREMPEREALDAIGRAKKSFAERVEEIRNGPTAKESARQTKAPKDNFDRWDWINFYRQGSDISVSLQGGQDPMLVLAQQGTQIADIFLTQERGPIKAMKEFGSAITRFALNPVTLFTASLTGLGYAAYRYGDQQAELNRSLNGAGRSAGASAGQLLSISNTAARSGSISQGQAVSATAQYASAGIGVENIPTLLADTRRFSHAFGLDMDAAQKEIAQIVSEEGLGTFEKRFGAVSFATKEWVRALEQSGRFAEAAAVKTRLLDEETQKAKDSAGLLTRVWEPVSTAISNAFGAIGAGIDALVPKFQTVELPRAAQAAAQTPGMGSLSDYERRIGLAPEVTPAQSARNLQELNKRSDLAGRTIDAFTPEEGQRRGFQRQLDLLKPFTESAEALALLGDRAGQAREVFARLAAALATFETPAERMRRDNELAVQSIGAYSLEQRAGVAAEQARVATMRETHIELLANLAAEGARNVVLAESRRRLDDMEREAEDRAQLRGLSPFQASQREIDIRYSRLLEQSDPADAGRIERGRRNARLDLLSQTATQALDTARPDLAQLRQINDARAAISELLNDKDGLAALGPRAEEARQALDNLANRMSVWRSTADTILQDAALSAKATEAYTFSQRELVSQQQAWLSVMRQSGDASVAAAEAEKVRISLIAEGNKRADDMLRQAKNESALIGLTPYEAGRERIKQEFRDFRAQNVPTNASTDYRSSLPPAILSPIESGFKAAGDAATRLADRLDGVAGRITGQVGVGGSTGPAGAVRAASTSAANVVPLFARTNDIYSTIMRAEGTAKFGDPYNTSLGYRASPKPLVDMSMRESLAWGEEIARQEMIRTRKPREDVSSAKGAYQIVNSTQRDAMRALSIGDNEPFSAANQDRMAAWIMRTQGPGAWEGLKKSVVNRADGAVTSRSDSQSRAAEAERLRTYDWSQIGSQIEAVDREMQSHVRTLNMQRAAVSSDEATLRGLTEAQQLYNRFAEQRKDADTALVQVSEDGVVSTMKLTDAIAKLGQKAIANAREEEEFVRVRNRYIAELDISRGAINEGFTNPLKALSRGEDPGAAALSALQATQDRLIDMVGGQFTESLLGKTGTTNTGVLGSLFGFGSQQNVAQATITAGVVNVNGGVGGVPGTTGSSGGGLFGWIGNAIGSLFGGGSIPTMAQGGYGPDMPVGFADGGVMTSAGALPMQRSSAGGVADRPQLALFGEGRYPEAYIPMRDGRSISVAVDDAGRAHAELPGGRGVPVTLRGALADRSLGGGSRVSAFADGGVMTAQGQAAGQFYHPADRPTPSMPIPIMPHIQMASAPAAAPVTVNIHEAPGVKAQVKESTDAKGGRRIDVVIKEQVAESLNSSQGRDAMAAYGARPRLARR